MRWIKRWWIRRKYMRAYRAFIGALAIKAANDLERRCAEKISARSY